LLRDNVFVAGVDWAACELGAEVFMPVSLLVRAHRSYRDVP